MTTLSLALLLCIPGLALCADDNPSELYTCSFTAHTPAGDFSGTCTTQSLPAEGFRSRWAFTFVPGPESETAAASIRTDVFFDMVRSQCLQDGSFTAVMPLWGDFVLTPADPDYRDGNRKCAPLYEVDPNRITLTRSDSSPLTIQLL